MITLSALFIDWVHINYNKLLVKSIRDTDSNGHKDYIYFFFDNNDSEMFLVAAELLWVSYLKNLLLGF